MHLHVSFSSCKPLADLPVLGESPYGMEKAPRFLGSPAAAQGMVSDGGKETNCLASAGEKLGEQMAQSFFSLLLLP